MSIKGNIKTFYLSSLLQILSNDKKTGVLTIVDGSNTVEIYLNDGTIVFASSSQEQERLCYYLVSENIVNQETIDRCMQAAEAHGVKIGKVLVDQGYISAEDLTDIIHDQVQNIIFNLFLWDNGDFEYLDKEFDLSGQIQTEFDTMEIVLEASRQVDEISVLRKQLPNENEVLKLSEGADHDLQKLNEDERPILALVNNKRTIKKIIHDSGYDDFSVYKVLYSLVSSGIVEKSEEAQQQSSLSASIDLDLEEEQESEEIQLALEDLPSIPAEKQTDPILGPSEKEEAASKAEPAAKKGLPLSKKQRTIAGIAGGAIVVAAVVMLVLKPFVPEETPPPPVKQTLKKPKSEPAAKKPSQKKQAPESAREPQPEAMPVQQVIAITGIGDTHLYQDPAGVYSINLPVGFEKTAASPSGSRAAFVFDNAVRIQFAVRSVEPAWNAEDAMYRKVMDIQGGAGQKSTMTVGDYSLVEIGGARGYMIDFSGYIQDSSSKISLYALETSGKVLFIDINCANWRKQKNLDMYTTAQKSIRKTLIVY